MWTELQHDKFVGFLPPYDTLTSISFFVSSEAMQLTPGSRSGNSLLMEEGFTVKQHKTIQNLMHNSNCPYNFQFISVTLDNVQPKHTPEV